MNAPIVSVVIPTCGRTDLLRRCLDRVCSQSLPPSRYEVIVVDDGPDPRTQAEVQRCAAQAAARGLRLHYLPNPGPHGPAAARNRGWRAARAALVAFTDDDTVPHADWLARGCAAFEAPAAPDAGWGRIVMPIPEQPTDYERDARQLEDAGFVTANCFCHKAMLERIDGFDERFAVAWREDTDLYFRLREAGAAVIPLRDAIVVHPVRPGGWGVCLSQQRKILFDALLYKKHPQRYRAQIRRHPRWDYYLFTLTLLVAVIALLAGATGIGLLAAAAWFGMVLAFFLQRLRGTRKTPAAVCELFVTSVLIPPLAVFWRAVGALRFRVLFL